MARTEGLTLTPESEIETLDTLFAEIVSIFEDYGFATSLSKEDLKPLNLNNMDQPTRDRLNRVAKGVKIFFDRVIECNGDEQNDEFPLVYKNKMKSIDVYTTIYPIIKNLALNPQHSEEVCDDYTDFTIEDIKDIEYDGEEITVKLKKLKCNVGIQHKPEEFTAAELCILKKFVGIKLGKRKE